MPPVLITFDASASTARNQVEHAVERCLLHSQPCPSIARGPRLMETCLFGVSDGSAGWVVQPFVVRANKLPVGGVCFTYHMA